MNDMMNKLPGLERVRQRFLVELVDRKARMAQHALLARNAPTTAEANRNLDMASAILHQISGTAGLLGFAALGAAARECEDKVISHLESAKANALACHIEIINQLDGVVDECRMTLDGQR